MTIRISVIIPVYQDWKSLERCLDALERQTLPPEQFEIVVVNNEAEDSAPLGRLPGNARTVHEPRPGSYAARNRGVAVSTSEFLAFTDSDCVPSPGWLEHGLAILESNSGTRVTGPVPIFRPPGGSYSAYLYDLHTGFHQQWAVEQGRCATANLLVARHVFDRVGPFNPALVSGGDMEWGTRAADMGVPIVYGEAVVVEHPARGSLGAIFRRRRRFAGSDAVRSSQATYRYVVARLVPPLTVYREMRARRGAQLLIRDRALLFLMHWATRVGEAQEFLFVRLGLKRPNRT